MRQYRWGEDAQGCKRLECTETETGISHGVIMPFTSWPRRKALKEKLVLLAKRVVNKRIDAELERRRTNADSVA